MTRRRITETKQFASLNSIVQMKLIDSMTQTDILHIISEAPYAVNLVPIFHSINQSAGANIRMVITVTGVLICTTGRRQRVS